MQEAEACFILTARNYADKNAVVSYEFHIVDWSLYNGNWFEQIQDSYKDQIGSIKNHCALTLITLDGHFGQIKADEKLGLSFSPTVDTRQMMF
jgi:hypothetical protein